MNLAQVPLRGPRVAHISSCQPAGQKCIVRRVSVARRSGDAPLRRRSVSFGMHVRAVENEGESGIDEAILEAARDPAISSLAERIIEAEKELKGMFEPGKLMPSAGSVAKKRQAIMDMKGLLASKLNGQEVPVNPDASDREAAKARKLFSEVERSLQRQQRSSNAEATGSSSNSFELTLLEVENDRLREKAEALLLRQQQLEDLAEVHGLISHEGGRLIWLTAKGGDVAGTKTKSIFGEKDGAASDKVDGRELGG